MRNKRDFLLRVLDIIPWEERNGISYAPWVHCSNSEARATLGVNISWIERAKSVEVHLLSDSPTRRVVIKGVEE
jgi:hypothetical protein